MAASSRPSSYHDVVDEPLLRTIAAEIQAAIPGSEMRLYSFGEACGYGSRARGQRSLCMAPAGARLRQRQTPARGFPCPCPCHGHP